MTSAEKPTPAFILGIISGVLIIIGGITGIMWMWVRSSYGGGWLGMMGPSMMGRWIPWLWGSLTSVVLISGVIILVEALMLQSRPSQSQTWGILILIFSMVSLFSMGGFIIGAILGIIAGILALTWRSAST
jgi:hypothetical protein